MADNESPAYWGVPKLATAELIAAWAALPADHVELSAKQFNSGNVSLKVLGGIADGQSGWFAGSAIVIIYPVAGAAGRDLRLECHGSFTVPVTIGTYNGTKKLDELTVSASVAANKKTSFKVLIDTSHPTKAKFYVIKLTK